MTAKEILDAKGRSIWSTSEDKAAFEAVADLLSHNIGLLIVRNSSGDFTGVLSERDIVRKCIPARKDLTSVKVREIMTPADQIVVAAEDDDVQSLMNTMTKKHIRHLPVFKGRELSGVISIGDIVNAILDIKDYEIKTLVDYIAGKYPA